MRRGCYLFAFTIAVALSGCGDKPEDQAPPVEDVAAAESTPPPFPDIEGPGPSVKRTAPKILSNGEFVLVKRVSVVTDSGVFGVGEGTPVKLVRESGSKIIVTDGRSEFEVTEDQLTSDVDTIEAMKASKEASASFPLTPEETQAHRDAYRRSLQKQIEELDVTISSGKKKLFELDRQQSHALKTNNTSSEAVRAAVSKSSPEELRIRLSVENAESKRSQLESQLRNLQ